MDILLGIVDAIGQLLPPKDERGKRWHRIGCFVVFLFGAPATIILAVAFLTGAK